MPVQRFNRLFVDTHRPCRLLAQARHKFFDDVDFHKDKGKSIRAPAMVLISFASVAIIARTA